MDYMSTQSMSTNIQEHEKITYRPPNVHQVDTLRTFFLHTLNENFSYFPNAAQLHYSKAWQSVELTRRIEAANDLLLCAWSNDSIAGLISGTAPEGGVGTIVWLTVEKNHQNRRIGAQLLSMAKEHYRQTGAHKIKLTVHDQKAVDFYIREKLVVEALHHNHWWNLNFWSMAYFI